MSSTDVSGGTAANGAKVSGVDFKLEVAAIPVEDPVRARDFYVGLGWRLDADFDLGDGVRLVQVTPPNSPASIQFASGPRAVTRGPLTGLILAVTDIEAAREELVGHGVEVSEIWHALPGQDPQPGRDPDGASYVSRASFDDSEGNTWQLQEINDRLPGRTW
jgi:catechol 2,3-dioxygenase-like lactoylglutathione lyase family enzyme